MSGPASGNVIDGKYRLLAPIGSGGMGSVWRAEHLTLRSLCAVKMMHQRIADSTDAAERFQREARAAAALRSPHVVGVLDCGISDGTPYVVMELLDGESLDQRLRQRGRLDFAETVRIVSQVARALVRAHEVGIVHRDLKPANVFLQHNADEEIVKVLDFGVAKLSPLEGVSPLTHTGAVLGSPHYMSPEQARGRRDVDHRTDCWALGVIAFECVTGRRPFESEVLGDLLLKICSEQPPPPSTLTPVPPGFDAWFDRAMARNPDERFQSAAELGEALRALVPAAMLAAPPAPQPALQPPPSASVHAAPIAAPAPSRSGAGIAIVLGASLLLVALLVVGAAAIAIYAFAPGAASTSPSAAPVPGGTVGSVGSVGQRDVPDTGAPPAPSASTTKASTPKGNTKSATPTATATGTATATAAGDSSACVKACNKVRACAPGANCDSSGPCSGYKRTLADCVNATPCDKIMDRCMP